MAVRKTHITPIVVVLLVIVSSLACSLGGLLNGDEIAPENIGASESEVEVLQAESDSIEDAEGLSRRHPIALNTLVSVPGWDIQVLKFNRGEAAAAVINAGDRQFDPPPAGYEYALANVFLRCTAMDGNAHSLGLTELFITGSSHTMYGDQMDGWPQPEFLYEDMFTAEAVEGWVDALIPVGETDLMLVLDIPWSEPRLTRYFALEESASIVNTGDIFNQVPNNFGLSPEQPAAPGEKTIMPMWDITVISSLRGAEALALLQQSDPDFPGPDTGEEFILLNVAINYFGVEDIPESLSTNNFYVLVDGSRFNGKIRYPRPSPITWINGIYFPGASIGGWMMVAIPEGLSNPVIAFDPSEYSWDQSPDAVRFIRVP